MSTDKMKQNLSEKLQKISQDAKASTPVKKDEGLTEEKKKTILDIIEEYDDVLEVLSK